MILSRVGEYRRDRGLSGFVANVEIHWHALPRSRSRALQRETFPPVSGASASNSRICLALGLPDSEREPRGAILAVPVVSKVDSQFARPEESMRRRECCDGTPINVCDHHTIARSYDGLLFVRGALECIVLPVVGNVVPHDPRPRSDLQPVKARIVLVGHRGLLGLRNHLLTNQVRALVDRVLQLPGKDAKLHAWERYFDARPVGIHVATRGQKGGGSAIDLIRCAWQPLKAANR